MSRIKPVPILARAPGVVITESGRIAEGRWVNSDKIRGVRGLPQKIGGNVAAVATPTSGVPRALHAWRDLTFNNYLAAGTYRKLYVYDTSFAQNDITPFRSTGTFGNNPFSTQNTNNVVVVNLTNHGANPGDTVIIAGATAFNNVTMNGTFIVQALGDFTQSSPLNNFQIIASTTANATGSGGGNAATYEFEIPVGVEVGTYGYGWGVGGWGLGTWGTARTASTIYIEPRVWSLDHFGKILVACYNGGSLYSFDPTQNQPWPRAQVMSSDPALPTDARALFVTPERYVFALRSSMQVSWPDQGSLTTWTPATNNTANSRTLTEGTKLVGGCVLAPLVSLVLSDAACYRFLYDGSAFVYSSALIGRDCGLLSPGGIVSVAGKAYWWGSDNFWMCDGNSVMPIPNVEDIRRYVFSNLPASVSYQVCAVFNPRFNEIDFYYPTANSTAPDHYVKLMLEDMSWWPGTGTRSSGTHFTQGDTRPYLGDVSGLIYQHENGLDDHGNPLTWLLTFAPYALDGTEGLTAMDLEGILFDFFQQSGNITCTINTYDRLGDAAAGGKGPQDTQVQVYAPNAGLTDFRIAGRYLSFSITCSDLGNYMRYGKPVAFVKPTARRR